MKPSHIPALRLQQQQLTQRQYKTAQELVQYMGAMQAQDDAMCKWAVGIRLNDFSCTKVEAAINKGEILRTHVLRPTWHLVAAQDIHWMLALTAPQIKRMMTARHKELELTPATLTKSHRIIEKLLAQHDFVTRNQLTEAFNKAKIATGDNRLAHILFSAELDAFIASGPLHNGKHTYALLDQRVKKKRVFQRDEALAELALRYFTSHGPATLQDFTWWSGLGAGDARQALESVKKQLASENVGETQYWMAANIKTPKVQKNTLFLLPAYDEYLISYKDRSAALQKQHQASALSTNGIFFPVMVHNGQVAGTWKRSFKKEEVLIEPKFFEKPTVSLQPALKKAAAAYAGFTNHQLALK